MVLDLDLDPCRGLRLRVRNPDPNQVHTFNLSLLIRTSFDDAILYVLKSAEKVFERPNNVGKVRGWPPVPVAGMAVRISSRLHLRGRRMRRQARCMRFLRTKKTQHVEAVLVAEPHWFNAGPDPDPNPGF